MNPLLKTLLDAGKNKNDIAALCGVSVRTVQGWRCGKPINASAALIMARSCEHDAMTARSAPACRISTHHNPDCNPPWAAMDMSAACAAVERGQYGTLTDEERSDIGAMMAGYSRIVDHLMGGGETEAKAIYEATMLAATEETPREKCGCGGA